MGNMHLVTGYAGKEHITAVDQGAFNAALIGTGQFVLDKGNGLAAQVITNNQVRILDGELMMQGRFIRLDPDTYVDLAIESGAQGYYRNDLIVARYTKDAVTGVEGCSLVVIKGTAVTGNPADPAYTADDITNGASALNDFPLWRIPISGINVGTPESMFGDLFIDSMRTLPEIRAAVNQIHSEVDEQLDEQDKKIQEQIDNLVSYTKEETLADTTKELFGMNKDAVPDDVLQHIHGKLGVQLELVWVNASPSSLFYGQTVGLDLSDGDGTAIVFSEACEIVFVPKSQYGIKQTKFAWAQSGSNYTRAFTVNTTGIVFEDANRSNLDVDYASAKPVCIYNVKGVSV